MVTVKIKAIVGATLLLLSSQVGATLIGNGNFTTDSDTGLVIHQTTYLPVNMGWVYSGLSST